MKKALPITIIFLLLTFSLTPFATAQQQNIITNETTETLYVIYSTKFGAEGDIPAGYRTSGWKTIAAGQQRTFWGYDPHKIYFQIWKAGKPIKPEHSTQTLAFWINRNANFDIVTRQEINASITREQLLYSSHGTNPLTHRDGFMQYNNGSQITVTNAWVDVDAPVNIPEPTPTPTPEPTPTLDLGGNTVTNALPITIYVTFATWQPADWDVPESGYRTTGYIPIPPGGSQTFHAAEENEPIFFRFQRLDMYTPPRGDFDRLYLSPAADTTTVSSWVPQESEEFGYPITVYEWLTYKSFNIVSPTNVVFGTVEPAAEWGNPGPGQIEFTDVPERILKMAYGFIEYPNGSDITVTGEWIFQTVSDLLEGSEPGAPLLDVYEKLVTADYGVEDFAVPVPEDTDTILPPFDDGSSDVPINIPDANLRRGIASELGKDENDPIYRKDMLTLRSLTATELQIADLTGLEFAGNLEQLELWYNNISDVSPLKNLVNLEKLELWYNNISDVSPLKNLVNLEHLDLWDNNISDVSPLKNLVNLEKLNLRENNISDVSPLKELINLQQLDLWDNPVHNVDQLSHLPATIEIDPELADGGLSPGSINIPDANLRSAIAAELGKDENDPIYRKDMLTLRSLTATELQIADLTGLGFADHLEYLFLGWNNISDVSPLKNLVNLEKLELWDNNISDVSPLKNLVNLEKLELRGNPVHNVDQLSHLPATIEIDPELADGGLSDVPINIPDANLRSAIASKRGKDENAPIFEADMLTLRSLTATELQIADLTGLGFATNLEHLYLDVNNISDVSPLKNLVNLTTLGLSVNNISDVSPLKNLVNLTTLGLSVNNISDVSPLAGLVNLTTLRLLDNPVHNPYTLSHLNANITFDPSVSLLHQSCGTLMPDTIEPLEQVRVPRNYEKTKVSNGIFEYQESTATVKAAVKADLSRHNRTWTIHDTVADDRVHLVLTVKFLSPTEARRLILNPNLSPAALVSPTKTLMNDIKTAAEDWAMHSNIRCEYLNPGQSGESDIRIAFGDPDKWKSVYRSQIGSPPASEKETYDRQVTMHLGTDVSYATILHEFGHALGLIHEHLSPQFDEWFTWDDTEPDGWDSRYPDIEWDDIPSEDRLYKKIAFMYKGFDPKTIQKGDDQAADIDRNFLNVEDVDEKYSEFDKTSVMTYGIKPFLLKAKSNAPDWAKELVDGEGAIGIRPNKSLSDRDKEFITDLYGQPIAKAKVSGTVEIDGIDHDAFPNPSDTIKSTKSVSETVIADSAEYVRVHEPIIFKWGGEMRVEVYIHSKQISHRSNFVEAATTALLYHGDSVNTTDLDSYVCGVTKVPLPGEHTAKITVSNGFVGFTGRRWCGGLELDADASGLTGDWFAGVNWWNKADITVKLKVLPADSSTPITAPAAPSIAAIANTAGPRHDVNGDGEINAADLLLVSQYFGRIPPETPVVDVNNDDTVTIADLVQVAQNMNLSPVPAAPSGGMPSGLTYRTVEGWIDTARVESDGSRVFQIGIANLEALLLLIVPEETVLLHNYPNPFNPETWIPYHLSEPADVALTIYAIDGKVVRHLDLGHQVAGFYQSKARAAHWDGRNNVGERVASGVYFYTLKAGEFAATRKMLILK